MSAVKRAVLDYYLGAISRADTQELQLAIDAMSELQTTAEELWNELEASEKTEHDADMFPFPDVAGVPAVRLENETAEFYSEYRQGVSTWNC